MKSKKGFKNRIFKMNPGFITQKIGDDTTIFSGEDSVLHTLNETAAFIFQGLKLGWNEDKIIRGLVDKFGAETKEAQSDLKEFSDLLLKKKILLEVQK